MDDDRLPAQRDDRSHATVYERAAWHHDIGEHEGAEHPYQFCPRCEMEHPEGRLAVALAEIERLTAERAQLIDLRVEAENENAMFVAELTAERDQLAADLRIANEATAELLSRCRS